MRDFELDAIATNRIWSYLWGKLGYGAMLFAQALGQRGMPTAWRVPSCCRPGVRSAPRRCGWRWPRASTARLQRLRSRRLRAGREGCGERIGRRDGRVQPAEPENHSGVWRDLAVRKRRTEVDVQIAPIAEIGARHGIDCPAVRRLVALIHEMEDGRRALSDDNLLELLAP